MHVDLDLSACADDAVEYGLPEVEAPFGDAAFPVDPERDAGDVGTGLEDLVERIPAVGGVGFSGQSLDDVVCVGTVDPLVGVCPERKLELKSATPRFGRNVFQRFEVAVPLLIGETGNTDAVTGDVDEEGIRKVEVGVVDISRKIVAETEGQAEAVEALGDEVRQVAFPKAPVVMEGTNLFAARARAVAGAERGGRRHAPVDLLRPLR